MITEKMNMVKDNWVVSEVLSKHAKEIPDKPSIQWRAEQPLTYKELYEKCLSIAGGLQEIGVREGDKVLLFLPNSIEIVLSWLGTNFLGAIEVPINIHYKGDYLVHETNDCGAKVAIVHSDYVTRFTEIAEKLHSLQHLIIVGEQSEGTKVKNWAVHDWDTIQSNEKRMDPVPVRYYDTAAIMYTSGTTGKSKGVVIPYGLAGIFAQAIMDVGRLTTDDVYYVCLPLFHANAQFMQVLPSLILGNRVSIWPSFSASQFWDQIRQSGATVTNTLGVMCEFIYRQPVRPNDADNPLRVIFALPTPKDIAVDFEKRFQTTCIEGYGMTESSVFTYRRLDEPLRLGSAGRPLDYVDVQIVDPETDEFLPPNTIGEIVVRPKYPGIFMKEYHGLPEKTVEAWRNLWFHTGDAGKMDEEGYLYFVDRINDSIRRRGENISSQTIESVLNKHPNVKESAAIAVPAEFGAGAEDEVMVFVVADGEIDAASLHDYCVQHMPYFAVPRFIEFAADLPKTPNQKIRKNVLRKIGVTDQTWDRVKAGVELKK